MKETINCDGNQTRSINENHKKIVISTAPHQAQDLDFSA